MESLDFSWETKYWEKGYDLVIGVDEVGRGALAGPIVAVAVVFPTNIILRVSEANREGDYNKFFSTSSKNNQIIINDSKKLNKKQREKTNYWIHKNCLAFGIGEVEVNYINKYGISKANRLAMKRAIRNIKCKIFRRVRQAHRRQAQDKLLKIKMNNKRLKVIFLIDGRRIKYLVVNQKAIVNGDEKVFSIAAASTLAKVYRDHLMSGEHIKNKRYRWNNNKGYGTKFHCQAILKHGVTKLHRIGFLRKIIF